MRVPKGSWICFNVPAKQKHEHIFDVPLFVRIPLATMRYPENISLIQRHLIILLHAHKCRIEYCSLPLCETMKDVLHHLKTCWEEGDCSEIFCFSSRQVISHWTACSSNLCGMCSPVVETKQEIDGKTLFDFPSFKSSFDDGNYILVVDYNKLFMYFE